MPTAARKSPPKKLSPVGGGKLGTASLKVVNGFASAPDGTFRSGTVRAILSQGATITANQEVVPESVTARIKPDGTWTLSLYSNSDLTPSGTYYTVTEIFDDGASYAYTIVIPGTAGPFNVASIQTGVPPSASPTPGHLSTLVVDGQVTFTGGPLSFPNGSLPESVIVNLTADLAARALDSTVVHLAGAETITGLKTLTAPLQLSQITTPAAPAAGLVALYAKNNARVYRMSATGSEIAFDLDARNIRDYGATGLGVRVFDGVMSAPLADPTVAPTVAASTTAANVNMPVGTYTVAYSYTNPAGETNLSPASAPITTTGPNPSIFVTLPSVLPMGALNAKLYIVSGPVGTVGDTGVRITPDGGGGGTLASYTAITISSAPNLAAAPGSNTTGSVAANVLSSATSLFTSAMVGWHALVVGCGDATYAGALLSTVASFVNGTKLTLADNAVISSNRATVYLWSDAMATADTAGLTGALTSLGAGAGQVAVPPAVSGRFGFYACTSELTVLQGQTIAGTSKRASCIFDAAAVGFNDVQSPTVAANATAANANMPVGTYTIGVTYVTARGETALNAGTCASAPITTTGPNPSILVTFGAIPAGVTQVKIWIMSGPGGTVGFTGVVATSGTSVVLSQAGGTVSAAVIAGGGTGYTVGDILTVQGGTGTAATLRVQQVSAGVITAVGVQSAGNYSGAPTNPVSVAGGTGTGATFNLTLVASPTLSPVQNTTQLLMRQVGAAYSQVRDLQLSAGKTTTAILRLQDTSDMNDDRLILDGGANPFQVECFTMTNLTPGAGGCYYDSFRDIWAVAGRIGFNLRTNYTSAQVNNNTFYMCYAQYNRDAGWYINTVQGLATYSCEAEQNGKFFYTTLGAQMPVSGAGWGVAVRIFGSPRVELNDIWIEGNARGTVVIDSRLDGLIIRPQAMTMYLQDGGGNGYTGIPSLLGRACEVEDLTPSPEVIYDSRRRTVLSDVGATLFTETLTQVQETIPRNWTTISTNTLISGASSGDAVAKFALRADGQLTWGGGALARDATFERNGAGIMQFTNTTINVRQSASTLRAYASFVGGDAQNRYEIFTDGKMNWGSGAGAIDVTLQRSAAGILALTLGDFSIAGRLLLTAATSKIVPGATITSFRNNADTADNVTITDAGVLTVARGWFSAVGALATSSVFAGTVTGDGTTRFVVDASGTHTWGPGNAGRDVTLARTGVGIATITGLTVTNDLTAGARIVLTTAISKIVPGATSLSLRNTADTADNLLMTDAGVATIRAGLTVTAGPTSLAGSTLGFYGTAPVVKPTISGSRGANAALASLLTSLAGQGLLTDSSTV